VSAAKQDLVVALNMIMKDLTPMLSFIITFWRGRSECDIERPDPNFDGPQFRLWTLDFQDGN